MIHFSSRFRTSLFTAAALSLLVASGNCAPKTAPRVLAKDGATAGIRLQLKSVASHGLVAQNVDLSALAKNTAPRVLAKDGSEIPSQFVPDANGASRGLLLMQLSRGGDFDLQIVAGDAQQKATESAWLFVARNAEVELTFDVSKQGGLPSRIAYLKSGKVLQGIEWRDRLYDGREYSLRNDKSAQLEIATRGALATVVRVHARFLDANGAAPPSQPNATYTWILWNAKPLIEVQTHLSQNPATPWQEAHTLEFQFNDATFGSFLGGDELQSSALKADKTARNFTKWGAFREGDDVFALLAPATLYDGRGDYGTYLVLNRPAPFIPWEEATRDATAWYFLGSDADAATNLPVLARQVTPALRVVTTSKAFEDRIAALRVLAAKQPAKQKRETLWRLALANRAAQSGDETRALNWLGKTTPADTTLHRAGDFGLAMRRTEGGVRVESLFDLARNRELLAAQTPALFRVALRQKASGDSAPTGDAASTRAQTLLSADRGWNKVAVSSDAKGVLTIRWSQSRNANLRGFSVVATAQPEARAAAWNWNLKVENSNPNWGISNVVFPRIALADEGEATRALYPQGSGIVVKNPVKSAFNYGGPYPNGWVVMPLMAVYHETKTSHGLYFAMHDPQGAARNLLMRTDNEGALDLSYDQPAPNIDKPATDFNLSGRGRWQLLRGNWFDAGQIYKTWAQKNASWWPKLGREGREDTPLWMRKLGGWATSFGSGKADEVSPNVLALQKSWGVPIGFHWYNWHAIPFDNDYPHYFPAKDGFTNGVKNLQSQNVHVMPYINGRIWDTRDKGFEDFEYTSRALPATTKEEKDGKLVPHTESYDSKESDGSLVVLAAMCPSTALWQNEIKNIVTRLTKDEGTDAVYIDQIAAAAPVLCLDPTHPHPAGGGGWWVKDYNEMMAKVRAAMPPGRMLTTECNAEPYIKSFDGYLTWHWQFDGQVPLFPTVYGGAIQMFGRAYGAGATSDIAMRMKSAQQLTWGEQIGWLAPDLALKAKEAPFLRRAVRTREQLARFFYAGQMARPPHLGGTIPTITADWEWQGPAIVTTDAALSGLWKIPAERKAALILSNVSESPIEITLDTKQLDLEAGATKLAFAPIVVDGVKVPAWLPGSNKMTLPPRAIYAWNVSW